MPNEEQQQQRYADEDETDYYSFPPGKRASPANAAALPRRQL